MTAAPILYGKPACVQCDATVRKLESAGITYDYIDVTEDSASLARIKELGYLQAPVVFIDENTHWSGNRPDKITEHLM